MLTATRRLGGAGFTTVELMVTLVVVSILVALATPTMRSVVANSRIRAASQSLQSGLAMARAEAVRLNTQVEFVLDSTGWEIRQVSTGNVLQQAPGREAGAGLVLTVLPDDADRITFNAFGQTASANPDGSLPITQIDIEATTPPTSGNYRPLRIELFGAGMSRLCDPDAPDTEYKACRRS